MIVFKPISLSQKEEYDPILLRAGHRGCAYSFANLYMWGRQAASFVGETLVFFSQFSRRSVYLFPAGDTDLKTAVDAIIHDAAQRGIPCRLTGLTPDDCAALDAIYPGKFRFHFDRNGFDYVYDIRDLADLKGRKFQKKRNHLNRFWQTHPDCRYVPLCRENLSLAAGLVENWYAQRLESEPHGDFQMEQAAIKKALRDFEALQLEGLLLMDGDTPLAMAMGSRLSEDTFDIHFEKALDIADGSYAAINQGFARHLRKKYPALLWLNREEDMGLEGLRKAKLSYCPHHLVEKSWACLLEDGYDY